MVAQSTGDYQVARGDAPTKRKERSTLARSFRALENGQQIAKVYNNAMAPIYDTLLELDFKDNFEKRMFYKMLVHISMDKRLKAIPLNTGRSLQLLYQSFKRALTIELGLDDLFVTAINKGMNYTVLIDELLTHCDKQPKRSRLTIYWYTVLEDLAGIEKTNKEYWIPNETALIKVLAKRRKLRLSRKQYYGISSDLAKINLRNKCCQPFFYKDLLKGLGGIYPSSIIEEEEKMMYYQLYQGIADYILATTKEKGIELKDYLYSKKANTLIALWIKEYLPDLCNLVVNPKLVEKVEHFKFEQLFQYLPIAVKFNLDWYLLSTKTRPLVQFLYEGNNIRKYPDFPFTLTKKMAHAFTDHYTTFCDSIAEINMHAFVKGFLDRDLISGRLLYFWSCPSEHYEELKALLVFINRQYNDYNGRYFERVFNFIRHRIDEGQPYSFKQKNRIKLNADVNEYYQMIQNYSSAGEDYKAMTWAGAPYQEWNLFQDNSWFAIVQLKSSSQLIAEGRKMAHCVGNYGNNCVSGNTSIWSLRKKKERWKSLVTIEVNHQKVLVQARRKSNKHPGPTEWKMIRDWAKRERIQIPNHMDTD